MNTDKREVKQPLTVRITSSLEEWIEEEADKNGVSKAEIVRRVLQIHKNL